MIVLNHEPAYFFGARRIEVENGIHEIDFSDVLLEPEEDLLLDPIDIETAVPYGKVLVIKAEIATKHAAALSLNANDPSLVIRVHGQMGRRKMVQVLQNRGVLVLNDGVAA